MHWSVFVLFIASSYSAVVVAQDSDAESLGQQQDTQVQDPNSLVGTTVKLSPQMRVMPREESSGLQEQELKEMQDLLREYHRGSIRSKPLE